MIAIRSTHTLRTRASGEIAFFRGVLSDEGMEGAITLQTRTGDVHQYRVSLAGDAIEPQSQAAAAAIADQLARADAKAVARAETRAAMKARSGALLDEVSNIILSAEAFADISIAEHSIVRNAVAERIAAAIEHATDRSAAELAELAGDDAWRSIETRRAVAALKAAPVTLSERGGGVDVRFAYDVARLARFRSAFPTARWQVDRKVWHVASARKPATPIGESMTDCHDWETDPRPYDACIKDWRTRHGWTWRQVADELREPLGTVQRHAKGNFALDTRQRRRLMTLIDQSRL